MRLCALLSVLAILVAGCASSASGAHGHQSSALQWGVVGTTDVPTLDPALASDATSISVASLIYGGLVRFDSHLRVHPDGARSWTISGGGTVYTFFLRHDLRFPDGRRVTASDFAAALRRSLGPEGSTGSAPFYLGLISHVGARGQTNEGRGITVVGPTTLRITLTHPSAHFLAELAFPASYVPELAMLGRYGPNWTDHAAGFGPFYVRVWQHSRYLTLQGNPHYYEGKPALKQITLRFYQDQQPAISAYQQGTLDVVSGFQAGETVAHGSAGMPVGIRRIPGLALDYLAFNTDRLPFFRLHARQAFASIWNPVMTTKALGDAAFAASTFLPPAFGVSSPRWQAIKKGSAYLALARYPQARGFPQVGLVIPQDPREFALANALSQAWNTKLGVHVFVRQLNLSSYSQLLNHHAFDLAIVRWGADYPDPQDFLGTQLGPSTDNVTGWSRRPYNQAVALADSYNPNDRRRMALFRQAARYAAGKVPLLPLDEPAQTALISPYLTHVELTPLGTLAGNWARAHFRG